MDNEILILNEIILNLLLFNYLVELLFFIMLNENESTFVHGTKFTLGCVGIW